MLKEGVVVTSQGSYYRAGGAQYLTGGGYEPKARTTGHVAEVLLDRRLRGMETDLMELGLGVGLVEFVF